MGVIDYTVDPAHPDACEQCGVVIRVGMHWQCPHEPYRGVAFADDIPGGLTVENYGPQPMTFYSHSARRRYMAENGLHETERFSPMPGTDKDPMGVQNPKGYMDPQTLDNARVLLSRTSKVKPEELAEIRNTFSLIDGGKDAEALVAGDTKRMSRVGRRINGSRSQESGAVDAGR